MMEISREQQKSLVEEVKLLTEENLDNIKVLERTNRLAIGVFGLLSIIDGDIDSVGFSLQDYTNNCVDELKGVQGAAEWAEESKGVLEAAVREKFSSREGI